MRSGWVRIATVLLVVVVVVLWAVAIAAPTWVLVTIAQLPGEDPARTARGWWIALGAFVAVAIPAVPVSVGLGVLLAHTRARSRARDDGTDRHGRRSA